MRGVRGLFQHRSGTVDVAPLLLEVWGAEPVGVHRRCRLCARVRSLRQKLLTPWLAQKGSIPFHGLGWRPTAECRKMTERRSKVADIEGVRIDRNGDGEIDASAETPIQAKLNLYEYIEYVFEPDELENEDEVEELAEDHEPGDVVGDEYVGGAFARVKYRFEDGKAEAAKFKDASSEDSGTGGWTGFDFLKVLPVADEVVERVPDVNYVRPSSHVLGDMIEEGDYYAIDQT